MSPTTSKESTPTDPSEGGENEEDISSNDFDSDRPRLLEADDEWRRVMTSLFNMVNQKEHGSAIHKFIKENLLRGEQDVLLKNSLTLKRIFI